MKYLPRHSPRSSEAISSIAMLAAGLIVPAIAAKAARMGVGVGYEHFTDSEPPKNPENPEVEWKEAIAWTICTAVIGGMARLLVRRYLARLQVPTEGAGMKPAAKRVGRRLGMNS